MDTARKPNHPRRLRRLGWVMALLWFGAIAAAMVKIMDYSNTPSPAGSPPARWPAGTALELDAKNPTLVMFAHPKCPCTAATIGNLDELMTLCQGKLNVQVVFVRPPGVPTDWEKTDTWTSASAIRGVKVVIDDGGAEARRFRIETSGDSLVYDVHGKLLFHGGITIARGHYGDSPGTDVILALVNHKNTGGITTPAFGCSLLGGPSDSITSALNNMRGNACRK